MISNRILFKIAEREGVDPTDLPILAETIDPDALESLIKSLSDNGSVNFRYYGYDVQVTGDGDIDLTEL